MLVKVLTAHLGKRWGYTAGELHRQLRNARTDVDGVGMVALIAEQDGKHLAPKKTTGNGRVRVLVLDRRVLGPQAKAAVLPIDDLSDLYGGPPN